jgi:PAS domain S-box-containing protein
LFQEIFNFKHFHNVLNTLSDGIYITDNVGTTLWMNQSSEKIIQKPRSELIGRRVQDLEAEGIFTPSVTRLALENGRNTSTVSVMKNGRKLLVTGHLLFNDQGQIDLVVCLSRDITEIVRTTSQLEETEALLRSYTEELRRLQMNNLKKELPSQLIGKSKVFSSLLELIDKLAIVDTTVLITGETGVGKSAIAKYMHQLSEQKDKPFIQINCGALPESLIESELFGYQKGAFTGANPNGKSGLVKMAENGTLFLDEIGELPLHLQVKLLQLIQEKTYYPIGSTEINKANVRIISATNCDLSEKVKIGKFRADLYYRMNILPIHIPPLRERKEDIFALLFFYLNKYNEKHNKKRRFSNSVLPLLQNYQWPGNIRELEHTVERLVIVANEDEIDLDDLPPETFRRHPSTNFGYLNGIEEGSTLPSIVEQIERELIQTVYETHKNTRNTADILGITQSALMRRVKKYQLILDK